ncbi:Uncharacterised protein [Elizabethkingia anophelis]|uniref:Uncharacterized protein n=1 Tax=Elizabethkingia anophelis TaxID=1117645 RepID=A0A7Z7LV59_9FLAO|nr:Uncharacterised protein [Elizabethkingia anophelis]STD00885.1 Uncharacterised protein [Elizabethkingia anophelis]
MIYIKCAGAIFALSPAQPLYKNEKSVFYFIALSSPMPAKLSISSNFT